MLSMAIFGCYLEICLRRRNIMQEESFSCSGELGKSIWSMIYKQFDKIFFKKTENPFLEKILNQYLAETMNKMMMTRPEILRIIAQLEQKKAEQAIPLKFYRKIP